MKKKTIFEIAASVAVIAVIVAVSALNLVA